MALQSPLVYGRFLASHFSRVVIPRLLLRQDDAVNVRRYTRLITAYCGYSKDFRSSKKRFAFGEDAFFVAEDRARSFLGRSLTTLIYTFVQLLMYKYLFQYKYLPKLFLQNKLSKESPVA